MNISDHISESLGNFLGLNDADPESFWPVLRIRIRIRIRIHRIHVFLGLQDPDPDPLVRGMDPDPSIIMQK